VGIVVVVLTRAGEASAAIDYAAIRATKHLAVARADAPIVLDGRLGELAWARAEVGRDFYQQQPDEGALATEPSEIRFLHDLEALYVGGTFYDRDPRGGITNELKRDFAARDGDLVTVVLDTFHDQRNSFAFMINPAGAERDVQSYEDGRQSNANWDGVWWVKTARFEQGWTMEMRIPFKTLRFRDVEEQVWGMNVFRLIRRKNEITLWSPVPRQFTQMKVSYAGRLTGIRGIRPGRNLRVKPFATGLASNVPRPDADRRWDADGGVDVKYGLGTALTLDLTYRTDFSQVEADEQQINLTRFSLFFPEKREFFLENQGAFRIGDQDASGQPGGFSASANIAQRRDLLPFFSRRIGLSEAGQPIPIVGGARLTGKQRSYSLGLLNIQTERFNGQAGDNFTAMRVARDVGVSSSIGGFYLGREAAGADGSNRVASHDFNRVAGGSVHLNFRRSIDVNGFVMRSASDGGATGLAGRAALNISENLYAAHLSYTNVSPGFRNDLGFTPRGDIGLTAWGLERRFRPKKTYRWVRTYAMGTVGEVFETSGHDGLLSRRLRVYTDEDFADGGSVRADLDWSYELLTAPFRVSRDIFIPPGEYRFRQISPSFTSDRSRSVSVTFKYTDGEYYSGTIRGAEGGIRVRMNEKLAGTVDYARNTVDLAEGRFDTDLARFRVDYSFTTHMFLNAFVQYTSASRSWLTNVRYRLIYRPLSDFYVVYNDTRTAGQQGQRTIAINHTILLSF
jgi:hypothetical protein